MTPAQEKAKQLFDEYYLICQEYTEEIQCSLQAKACALKAVDILIGANYTSYAKNVFWCEVIYEINKL